jgi:hypothetical protein
MTIRNHRRPLSKPVVSELGTVNQKLLVGGVRRTYQLTALVRQRTGPNGEWVTLGRAEMKLRIDFDPADFRRQSVIQKLKVPGKPALERQLRDEFRVGKKFELLKPNVQQIADGHRADFASKDLGSSTENLTYLVDTDAVGEIGSLSILRSHGLDSALELSFSQKLPERDAYELAKQVLPGFKEIAERPSDEALPSSAHTSKLWK